MINQLLGKTLRCFTLEQTADLDAKEKFDKMYFVTDRREVYVIKCEELHFFSCDFDKILGSEIIEVEEEQKNDYVSLVISTKNGCLRCECSHELFLEKIR